MVNAERPIADRLSIRLIDLGTTAAVPSQSGQTRFAPPLYIAGVVSTCTLSSVVVVTRLYTVSAQAQLKADAGAWLR